MLTCPFAELEQAVLLVLVPCPTVCSGLLFEDDKSLGSDSCHKREDIDIINPKVYGALPFLPI